MKMSAEGVQKRELTTSKGRPGCTETTLSNIVDQRTDIRLVEEPDFTDMTFVESVGFESLVPSSASQRRRVLILDGGMGTTLQAPPFELELASALWR